MTLSRNCDIILYDESGIVGMQHTGSSAAGIYYFHRNLLGDVVGIYNSTGTKVGGYAYDAWGNCTVTLDTNGIATKNPIRYRGYYYDQESGLYIIGWDKQRIRIKYDPPGWFGFDISIDIGQIAKDFFGWE